jgi:hypothetical protein
MAAIKQRQKKAINNNRPLVNMSYVFLKCKDMKLKSKVGLILIFLLNACSPSLDKGFEAMSIYDYFKARKIFYAYNKSTKKNKQSAAQYGIAAISSRHDNPFYHLDTAIKYWRFANINYELIPKNKKTLFYKTNITHTLLDSVKYKIDSALIHQYPKAIADSSHLLQTEAFINTYFDHSSKDYFIQRRDSLALAIAKNNGANGMYQFLKSYPNSLLKREAERLRDGFIFKSSIENNSFESFERFINLHAQNEFKNAAIDSLYEITLKSENIEWLNRLLINYPSSKYLDKSRTLYIQKKCIALKLNQILKVKQDEAFVEYLNQLKNWQTGVFLSCNTTDDKNLIINLNGNVISKQVFNDVQLPQYGIGIVSKESSMNLIDEKGQTLLNTDYEDIEFAFPFHYIVSKNGKYGLINVFNETLIYPQYDELNFIPQHESLIALKDKKYGLISPFNKILLAFEYDNISELNQTKYLIKKQEQLLSYDIKTKAFQTIGYDWVDNTHAKWLKVRQNNKYGITDRQLETTVAAEYDRIKILNDSAFLVIQKDQFGIINAKGNFILPIDNLYNEALENELLCTPNYRKIITKKGEGIINIYKQEVVAPKNKQSVKLLNASWALIYQQKAYSVIDLIKKQVVHQYKQAPESITENILFVKEKNKGKLIHLKSNKKTDCDVVDKWQNYLIVEDKEKYLLLDHSLNKVITEMADDYHQLNERCLQLNINQQIFIFDKVSGQLIKVDTSL